MPKGRPQVRPFMKIGAVSITRPDNLNWAIEQKGHDTLYYSRLPAAIKRAAQVAAESRAHDAQEWLQEYDRITGKLETTIRHALKQWTEEGA